MLVKKFQQVAARRSQTLLAAAEELDSMACGFTPRLFPGMKEAAIQLRLMANEAKLREKKILQRHREFFVTGG
jgi:hypothetical protein